MGTITYQTKKCPHCGKVYSNRSVHGPDAKEKLLVFGPLFVKCNSCGQMFRDSDAVELAVMDPPKFYLEKFHLNTILLSTMLTVFGFVAVSSADNAIGAMLLLLRLAALLLLLDYLRYKRNLATVERERAASVRRLKQDPIYAMVLKASGFNVPQEYLPQKEPVHTDTTDENQQ